MFRMLLDATSSVPISGSLKMVLVLKEENKQITKIWVMIVSIVLERQKARTIHNKAVSFVRLENLSNAGSQRQYLRSQKVLQMIESSE